MTADVQELRGPLRIIEDLLNEAHDALDDARFEHYELVLEKIIEQATAGIDTSSNV